MIFYPKYLLLTILHEIAHAIQESHGIWFDEEDAELFANRYYYTGQIIDLDNL